MPRNVDGEIIVGIDIPASTKIVEADIQKLLNNLTTLEAKINHADLTDNAKKELQQELAEIKNLTANVTNIELDDIAKQEFRNAVSKVDNLTANIQNVKLDNNFKNNLQTALNGLSGLYINIGGINVNKNALQGNGQQVGELVGKAFQKGLESVTSKGTGKNNYYKIDEQAAKNFETAMKKQVNQWTKGKGSLVDVQISTKSKFDEDIGRNIETLSQAVVTYKNEVGEAIKKTIAWRKIAEDPVDGHDIFGFAEIHSSYSKSLKTSISATDKFVEKQKKASAKMRDVLKSAKADFENQDRARPISEESNLEKLRNEAKKVEIAIDKMSKSSRTDFVDMQIEAQKLQNELNILIRKLRDAENASSKLKGTKTDSGIGIATADFEKIKTQAKLVHLDIEKLSDAFNNMIMHQGTDKAKQYLDAFNDQLRVSKAELDATNTKLKLFSSLQKQSKDNQDKKRIIDEKTVNSLLEQQISAYKKIQDINKQISKETDSGIIKSLQQKKSLYQKDYLNTQKELSSYQYINPELYNKALEQRRQAQSRILQEVRSEINIAQQRNRADEESRKITADRTKYHTKLNTAKKEELALAKQLVTANGKQREITRSAYDKRVRRVSYNKNELTKRDLWQGNQQFDFNTLSLDGADEVNRLMAKEVDRLTSALNKLEQEYKESGASVDVYETKLKELRTVLSGIVLDSKNVGKNLTTIGNVRDTISGISDGRSSVNNVLTKRADAYRQILTISNQIARLDAVHDSEHIAKLQEEKRVQQGIFDSCTNELNVLSKQLDTIEERNRLSKLSSDIMTKTYNDVARDFRDKDQQKDNKQRQQNEAKINSELAKQKNALNDILQIEGKIKNLDPKKDAEKIADLKNQKREQLAIYNACREQVDILAKEIYSEQEILELKQRQRQEMQEQNAVSMQSVSAQNEQKLKKKNEKIVGKVADNTYATQINDLITKYKQYGFTVDQAEEKVKELRTALATMSKADISADERIKAEQRFQEALRKSNNEVKVYQQNQRGLATDSSRLALANTMESFLQKNTKITSKAKQEIVSFIAQLRNLDSEMTRVARNEMNDSFRRTQNEMRALGKLGYAFSDQMKQAANSFTQWFSVSSLIMSGIYHARNAVTELKEIDTYLTEISKANNELTKSELADIGNHSFDIASNYGKTATDFLSAVQEASRAGYDNAEGIAELSTAAQGAGDMTADVANQMLIATDKAYKMNGAVDLLRNTLDGMNFITNNNAVNMTELSEGMTIVASTAASFGVDVNELTAALGTMSATTQQSGSEVARAFRAILLNIRQVSDEEEGIDAEGLTKYERACNDLGVSLKETKNGVLALRDPMDVLRELSVEYNKLEESDLRRTELLNAVGGKLRATQLDALLRQWSMYEKMLGEYEAGMGSMAVEAEKTANSWQGSLNRLSNTFADTIGNIVNSDSMITLINSFNTFLEVINKTTDALGAFGSVGVIGAGIFGAKGQG